MEKTEILGQEKLLNNLKQALNQKQISHTYLIEGQRGVGRSKVANFLAMGILCRSKDIKPCYECISCMKIKSHNHPEINWIYEQKGIGIEIIRNLKNDIQLKPYEGEKKVYILCDAEKITIPAQNALLKILEEPPLHANIILIATKGNSLLPTILSRSQRLKIHSISPKEIEEYLIEKKGLEKHRAKLISSLSNGIIGKALQLLEDENFQERRKKIISITKEILNNKKHQILENINFFVDEKEHIDEMLDLLMVWYRDVLIYKDINNKEFIINIDALEEIIEQSEKITFNNLKEIIYIIEKTKQNLKNNVNFQMNIEVMLIDMANRV